VSGIGRFELLLNVFALMPDVGPNLRCAIHETWQVRNNLVHSGGIADKRLSDACPWLGVEVGKTFVIPHIIYAWCRVGAERFAERVANKVVHMLGFEGYHCHGMDEIGSRPELQQTAAV
jgi:hypothetical protein